MKKTLLALALMPALLTGCKSLLQPIGDMVVPSTNQKGETIVKYTAMSGLVSVWVDEGHDPEAIMTSHAATKLAMNNLCTDGWSVLGYSVTPQGHSVLSILCK